MKIRQLMRNFHGTGLGANLAIVTGEGLWTPQPLFPRAAMTTSPPCRTPNGVSGSQPRCDEPGPGANVEQPSPDGDSVKMRPTQEKSDSRLPLVDHKYNVFAILAERPGFMKQNTQVAENTDITEVANSDRWDKSAILTLLERIQAQILAQLDPGKVANSPSPASREEQEPAR